MSLIAAALVLLPLAGCGAPRQRDGHLAVVAAENTWGAMARELGRGRVAVKSIVTDPNADPHEYTSNPDDARAVSTADEVIVNGAGYDSWAGKLLAAGGSGVRHSLDVASLLRVKPGANPHFWYDPADVEVVARAITADYVRLDPTHAADYRQAHIRFDRATAPYRSLIATIRRRFAGVRIAATESIFVYMARALGLSLVSPPDYMQALSQGTEPPAQSVIAFERQLRSHGLRALIYNSQTATAATANVEQEARAARVPVVGVSETLQPPGDSFEAWQLHQLRNLASVLRR